MYIFKISLTNVFRADIYTYIQLENNVSQFLAIRIFYVTTYSFLRKMYVENYVVVFWAILFAATIFQRFWFS